MRAMSVQAGRSFALCGAQDDTNNLVDVLDLGGEGVDDSVILRRGDAEGSPDASDERPGREILRPLRGSG